MFKKIIPILTALAVIPSAVSFTAHADGGHHGGGGKSRFVPYAPFNDYLNYLNDNGSFVPDLFDFYQGVQVLQSSATDTISDNTTEVLQTWDKFKSYLVSHMYSNVSAQRVKDLVDYANQSTDGLTTGQAVTSFIAKRSFTLSYDDNNNPSLVETDTMYFWKDDNHTIANDFTGVQLGNFYMMPNTAFFIREFSDNRTPIMFYADVSNVQIVYSDAVSGFDNRPFQLRFSADTTYNCVDSDGNVDSLTTGNRTLTDILALNDSDKNSIDAGDALASQAMYNTHFSEYTENGILPNIFVFTNNVQKSDGTRLFPNNWRGGGGVPKWYLSSGGFFPKNFSTTSLTFNTQTDTNIDPRKPPAIKNPDPRLNVNTLLTTANVDNYADFGVTYNSLTGKFDLDVNALVAGLAAQIAPQFEGVFNGVYQAQPDIDSNDWNAPSLTNNYVSDYSDLVVDISNEVQEVLDSRSPVWVPPRFPALETDPIVSYTYPTLPTNTVPQSVLDDVGTVSRIGFDAFDTLGDSIIGILVALAVLGAVAYFIWG